MSLSVLLRCNSLRETRSFYRDSLGFEVVDSGDNTLTATLNGGTLIFTESDLWRGGCAATSTTYFRVRDVDRYFASVQQKVTVAWPVQAKAYGSREFGIKDCNGYHLAFQTARPEPLRNQSLEWLVEDADLSGSHFSNVKLEDVSLENVNMRAARLRNVALSGASVADADLSEVSIVDSNIKGLTIDGIVVSDVLHGQYRVPRKDLDTGANLTVEEIKAFVPARDFELAKRFYSDLGFTIVWSSEELAQIRVGKSAFLLQQFFVPEHAGNFMMHMLVRDVDAWWTHVQSRQIASRYAVRVLPPEDRPWGIRDFVIVDPTGVLWRIGQNIRKAV